MEIEVQVIKAVTYSAIGLITSGYDLYDRADPELVEICNIIVDAFRGQESLLSYFRVARRGEFPVNPYWPRGSVLTIASCFIDEKSWRLDMDQYLTAERRAESSPILLDKNAVVWLKQLPKFLKVINDLPASKGIINRIEELHSKRMPQWLEQLQQVRRFINNHFDLPSNVEEITFVPNVLQAPELADLAIGEKGLIVISTRPRLESILHELTHTYIHPLVEQLSDRQVRSLMNMASQEKMMQMGYYWGSQYRGAKRVIEESFVRIATEMLIASEPKKGFTILHNQGFVVPQLFMALEIHDETSISHILELLSSCI